MASERSVIELMIRKKYDEVRGEVLRNPACINDRDPRSGVTLLHIACGRGSTPLVEFLCEQPGIDLMVQDHFGRFAFQLAWVISREDLIHIIHRALLGDMLDEIRAEPELTEEERNPKPWKPSGPEPR